jgi:DNA repair exonuclease SbcCD ATPase subunit
MEINSRRSSCRQRLRKREVLSIQLDEEKLKLKLSQAETTASKKQAKKLTKILQRETLKSKQLQAEVAEAKNQVEELSKKLDEEKLKTTVAKNQVEELSKTLDEEKLKLNQLQAGVAEAKNQTEELSKKLDGEKLKSNQLQAEVAETKKQTEELLGAVRKWSCVVDGVVVGYDDATNDSLNRAFDSNSPCSYRARGFTYSFDWAKMA